MPSRLWIPGGATAAPVSPAYDASWNITTAAVRRNLNSRATDTNMGTVSLSETSAVPVNVLGYQLVSVPLPAAKTLEGTLTFAIPARGDSSSTIRLLVKVVSGDGATVRGTAFVGEHTSGQTNPYITSRTITGALTPVAAQSGDRVVVELGFRFNNSSTTSVTSTLIVGDRLLTPDCSGVDGGETMLGADYKPWLEFSQADIWGPPTPRLLTQQVVVAQQPDRTPLKLASMQVVAAQQPARTELKLAALQVQAMVPLSGQGPKVLTVAGSSSQPFVKTPAGWRVVEPVLPETPPGNGFSGPKLPIPVVVYSYTHNTRAIASFPASLEIRPDDVLIYIMGTKTTNLVEQTAPPTGVPGVTWTRQLYSYNGDSRRVYVWTGTGATGTGQAVAPAGWGNDTLAGSTFMVLRNVKHAITALPMLALSGAVTVPLPSTSPSQVVVFGGIAGNGASIIGNPAGTGFVQTTVSGTVPVAWARITPLAAAPSMTFTIDHASGVAAAGLVIG